MAKKATEDVQAVKTPKKPGRKPMTAEEKVASAKAREEAKAKAEKMVPEMMLQYAGTEQNISALVDFVKEDFKKNHKRTLLTELKLYIKPEDSAVYYVANGSFTGQISF